MRLFETIASFFGRVEVVLAGVENQLREGEEALARGDAMQARKAAKAILARVPQSPLGLALLADACEAARLDAELALTLEELAGRVASRADVWVRLGRARERVGSPIDETRDAFLRALTVAEPGTEARREALLWLADLDLAHNDGPRAELWLERLGGSKDKDVVLRRAEARLLQGDVAGARAALEGFEADPTDGRAALLQGRALSIASDAAAFPLLLRAMVLETPGASEALASALAWLPTDEAVRAKVRTVVEGRGETDLARWRAAFARAEGRHDEALRALRAVDAESACPICTLPPLAITYRAAQQPDSAIALFNRYIETPWLNRIANDPVHLVPAHLALGELYEARGETAQAVRHYARVTELWADADPLLQPRVVQAQEAVRRLARLER
jgi:cellulose synthase operon protein C